MSSVLRDNNARYQHSDNYYTDGAAIGNRVQEARLNCGGQASQFPVNGQPQPQKCCNRSIEDAKVSLGEQSIPGDASITLKMEATVGKS